ncbi:transcriptional regulator, TetR family [Geosporobacter subterraneus DSM 17957]|uniref:Transcriptional regulator, TetR family n=1 Tax=Geosporobacter subterraneus DSM 17957 TaxID=1121919 RepID=A0A1M6P4Z6_9FIRM|nr:TetR/AcrR family transcriptional regulator [Geosporobacter subterraneus]SHK02972.1 transcriptional regulator, TetR family [Geosporobacter subterraneus DSM 17957]
MAHRNKKKYKKLLEISEELFWKYGYHRVTMDEIAKAAGISKATVYTYFPTKDDLFLEVLKSNTDYHMEKIMEKIDANYHTFDKIDCLYTYMLNIAKEFPMILSKDIMERMNVLEKLSEYKTQKVLLMWKHILEDGIQKGEIRALDVDFAANLLLYMPTMFMKMEYLSMDENQRVALYENLFDFMKYGLLGGLTK